MLVNVKSHVKTTYVGTRISKTAASSWWSSPTTTFAFKHGFQSAFACTLKPIFEPFKRLTLTQYHWLVMVKQWCQELTTDCRKTCSRKKHVVDKKLTKNTNKQTNEQWKTSYFAFFLIFLTQAIGVLWANRAPGIDKTSGQQQQRGLRGSGYKG